MTAITFVVFLGIGASVPLLPTFIKDVLGGSDLEVGISAAAFSLAAVLMRPFVGPLGDRHGRRQLMIWGSAITAIGLILQVFVDSVTPLYILRIIQGIGEGAFFVGAATLVADLSPSGRRGEAASYFSVALYAGIGIGPVAGEWIRDNFDYDAAWWSIGAAVGLGAIASIRLPERVAPVKAPDGQRTRFAPVLHKAGVGPGVILLLGTMPWVAFSNYMPLHAQELNIENYSRAFAFYSITVIAVRIFGAKLPDRVAPRRITSISLGIIAVAMLTMATLQTSAAPFIGAVLYGIGGSLLYPALLNSAVDSVDEHERSSVIASFTMFWDLGGLVGGLTFGIVAQQLGYPSVFGAAMISALAGIAALQVFLRPPAARVRTAQPADQAQPS